ncbi:MAG: hypothetical protein MUE99_07580 [Chitinophagaceae bacterium]|nr:hypothetical protein [Chitinophagaceae bacterium]
MVITVLILLGSILGISQNLVPFTKRTGVPAPPNNSYTVKGDFTMLGNTNLTLVNYSLTEPNSNNSMKFVDEDNDPTTINSSMSELKFTSGGLVNPACSRVVFAGLYWTGRPSNGGSNPDEFTVPYTTNVTNYPYDANQQVGHNGSIQYTPYTMSVSLVYQLLFSQLILPGQQLQQTLFHTLWMVEVQ